MKLESPKAIVSKSQQEIYSFITNLNNFEQLMPESIEKFEVDGDSFIFGLKGMPEIVLKKKEAIAPNKIVLGADGGKLDFSLTGNISEIDADNSQIQQDANRPPG